MGLAREAARPETRRFREGYAQKRKLRAGRELND